MATEEFRISIALLILAVVASAAQLTYSFQSEHGTAMFIPLHLNTSLERLSVTRERMLLGSARMTLHDDLLTKGYYTSRLMIGTPPQEFALIVDTGSTVTYVPCSSCTHCGRHQDPKFAPDTSTSYQPLDCGSDCHTGSCDQNMHCKYERQYAEKSSSSGVLGMDLVSFGNSSDLEAQRLIFGCETVETGELFYQAADGIMGLGRGPLSIMDQLVSKGSTADSFSLCYGGMEDGGGTMILGGFLPPSDMIFTYSDPERSPYYNLLLKGIRVAGTSLELEENVFNGNHGTVLDSGTTYAYFPEPAFTAFAQAVKQHLSGSLQQVKGPDSTYEDTCYAGAGTDLSKLSDHFPSVEFVFGDGQSLALTPENYLFRHTKLSGAYCLGVFPNSRDPTTLLGGIVVRNMLVTYDRANKKIGFWKTKCNQLWNDLPLSPTPSSVSFNFPNADSETGSVDLGFSIGVNYSHFSNLAVEFLENLASELHIPRSQIGIVNITAATGSNVYVHCTILSTSINTTAVISVLRYHQIHLPETFGGYNLTSWYLHSANRESKMKKIERVGAVVLVVVLVVSAVGLVIWKYKRDNNKHKYVTIDVDAAGVQLQQLS